MATPEIGTRVRPSALWYLVTLVLWIAAIVLAIIAWKPIIDLVKDGVNPVTNHAEVSVPSDGLTVYSTSRTADGNCSLVDSDGNATKLNAFASDLHWNLRTTDGRSFTGLGTSPGSLPAGTYTLTCPRLGDGANLGIGSRIDVGDVTRIALLGIIVPAILGLVGLIVLIVLLVRRHNSKSRIKAARAAPPGGYGYPGGWQGGGYPPPPPPPTGPPAS